LRLTNVVKSEAILMARKTVWMIWVETTEMKEIERRAIDCIPFVPCPTDRPVQEIPVRNIVTRLPNNEDTIEQPRYEIDPPLIYKESAREVNYTLII